jgi:hypothetical protein
VAFKIAQHCGAPKPFSFGTTLQVVVEFGADEHSPVFDIAAPSVKKNVSLAGRSSAILRERRVRVLRWELAPLSVA